MAFSGLNAVELKPKPRIRLTALHFYTERGTQAVWHIQTKTPHGHKLQLYWRLEQQAKSVKRRRKALLFCRCRSLSIFLSNWDFPSSQLYRLFCPSVLPIARITFITRCGISKSCHITLIDLKSIIKLTQTWGHVLLETSLQFF